MTYNKDGVKVRLNAKDSEKSEAAAETGWRNLL